jgi:hypothetical protein
MRLPLHVDLASRPEERVGGDVELRVRDSSFERTEPRSGQLRKLRGTDCGRAQIGVSGVVCGE